MASLLNNNNNGGDDESKGDDDDSNDIEFLRERTDSQEIEERRLQAVEDGTLIDFSIDDDEDNKKAKLTVGDDGIQSVLDTVNIMKEENENNNNADDDGENNSEINIIDRSIIDILPGGLAGRHIVYTIITMLDMKSLSSLIYSSFIQLFCKNRNDDTLYQLCKDIQHQFKIQLKYYL